MKKASSLKNKEPSEITFVAGVDGCPAGWIAVFRPVRVRHEPVARVCKNFSDILSSAESPRTIAVDMPIGLPEHAGKGGRGPESEVRKYLGGRQSSVFSVPSRRAVYCEDYREACKAALETSIPPRKVSKQCFNLFPKIREIDSLMTRELEECVYEVHPEFAFWRINNGEPMSLPKKVKGRPNQRGLEQRQNLLIEQGFQKEFFEINTFPGVGPDDLLDASVNSIIAERIYSGRARPYPDPFERDGNGLRVAIWS